MLIQLCMHHPRYWLWYTTQRCVSGVIRKVYQRLKLFKVQFLVLQRKTDPSQVMLQCLPADKVCNSPLSQPRHCVTQTDFIVGVNAIVMFMHEC